LAPEAPDSLCRARGFLACSVGPRAARAVVWIAIFTVVG
jgi:hypothetical protein